MNADETLGINAIYHHLYDFGTTSMFLALGKEQLVPTVREGEITKEKTCTVPLSNCNGEVIEKTFHILPTQVEGDKFDVVFDISMEGHASMNLIKASFFAK